MDYQQLHSWNLEPAAAIALQKELRHQIRTAPLSTPPKLVAGADISFDKYSEVVFAGFVVLDIDTLKVVAKSMVATTAKFPYISGLLSFREAPALLEAWEKLDVEPDVICFDGQGIAHPRRLGLASHMGLWLNRPSIGCAKTLLTGRFHDLPISKGSYVPLKDRGEQVGVALRTKDKVNPIFVSIGHLIELDAAIDIVMRCTGRYRIPEPTRQAHNAVNEVRVAAKKEAEEKIEGDLFEGLE